MSSINEIQVLCSKVNFREKLAIRGLSCYLFDKHSVRSWLMSLTLTDRNLIIIGGFNPYKISLTVRLRQISFQRSPILPLS